MIKRRVRCPFCHSLETVRNGRRKLKQGYTVQRLFCVYCARSFLLRTYPRARITFHHQVALTRAHLEGRTSIRTLARHNGHSTKTVLKAIHTITKQCVSAAWIATHLKPHWSGYLALDGKMIRVWDWAAKSFHYTKEERRWLHKMSLLVALDLGTLDVPDHHLGDEESMIDLVMFLESLRDLGYPLKGYVSDGNTEIPRAVEQVFGPDIPHQLCIRHYMQNLRDRLRQGLLEPSAYHDACQAIMAGRSPRYLDVPPQLYTYQRVSSLPRTNQSAENFIRFLELRLKTIGLFRNHHTARNYLDTLIAYRRFTKFTDRKGKPNGQAPLELAGCDITGIDYLVLGQSINRKVQR